MNRVLEDMLRHYINPRQDNWDDLLAATFCCAATVVHLVVQLPWHVLLCNMHIQAAEMQSTMHMILQSFYVTCDTMQCLPCWPAITLDLPACSASTTDQLNVEMTAKYANESLK